MGLLQGSSRETDGASAVAEATRGWMAAPEIVFVFVSTKQDAGVVAAALHERFPESIVVGCTTTGEHLNGEHFRGAVVMTGMYDTGIRWTTTSFEGLVGLNQPEAEEVAKAMFKSLGTDTDDFDPAEYFCISFIDGLRGREELITAHLAEALEGVQLVGGSAGDDLAFRETKVIAGGRAFTDGVVLVMGHAKDRFQILKHQHFTTTTRRLAITKVDVAARRVYEMDGLPALTAYALALDLPLAEVTSDVTFNHPLTLTCRGEIYVRSVSKVHEDGSISFFCAVEEGMVLEVGGHHDLVTHFQDNIDAVTAGKGVFDLLLGCNCILRALEADKSDVVGPVGAVWNRVARASIGFDTYGEQVNGMHINQTLVAIGFRGPL
jgi:hypothetical protein